MSSMKPMIETKGHPIFDYEDPAAPTDPDKYVYHYTKWERLLDIMQSGLRLSTLAHMNDPGNPRTGFFILSAMSLGRRSTAKHSMKP